ncbi:patatin-like phospholipase family protein [Verminephrobacter eiseniae]|uniref:patatin-like phospholipase family protein n=1 Tax=Verminephrobacter eiseniae TaxID=364317 RepID=UPI0010DEE3F0|nr:patatin-like phospholipase family protein [Verminephrobacter eiseniae]KAB7619621.1 patatin-like phospholipase family protein [Verminephrobacter sp. Larva24]MCW5230385.1 patatin-like phospholipase family protein [Verminephrobacter eiseniae]MCW5292119.1 patatin-like phospholipase family protein [Verminephrobacter eiseniae]MCW8184807.1 patatin-like phospholipase family protein [Verminephrobacter eiseniae]MCW8222545.1 patatin-like phospholipase family protein [Verminephrobacter eiseniae]
MPACAGPQAPGAAPETPATGLLLTGGGARAAYQVGVLEAIADLRRVCGAGRQANPFPIITGTSAGAINAAALASGADHFDRAVQRMARVWRQIHAAQVYGADSLSVMRSGARWLTLMSLGWALARWRRMRPRSLLDNAPLERLLVRMVPLARLPRLIRKGHLRALAVSASSYSSGEHVTFFESAEPMQPWVRSQRKAMPDRITHQHLLASSAIPFIFPAKGLTVDGHTEYFGDGSMRQSAPMAPAIHLGAERILVIGAGRMHEPRDDTGASPAAGYPTLAQMAGHALSSIFLDALAVDVERMQRINQTLALIPEERRRHSALRPIELLVIAPSQRLDAMAARHVGDLPAPIRTMLGTLGVSANMADVRGAALASYLLFEAGYTQELMALGRADTLAMRSQVCRFFGWSDSGAAIPARHRGSAANA